MNGTRVAQELLKIAKSLVARGQYVVSVSYETWTPEDVESGDTNDKGWDVRGEDFESLYEMIEYMLKRGASEPSDSSPSSHTWYTTEGDEDFRTGSRTYYSFHIDSKLTNEEIKLVFESVKKGRNLAPDPDDM